MSNHIEFASTDASNNNKQTPWESPRESRYEDLVLKPEYADRRLRFVPGTTWLRIVPAIQGSIHGWMMALHVLNFEGGRCNHPRTHKRKARSVFDIAYGWMKQNYPEGLYSKANKERGIRLLANPMCLFWALVVQEGKKPLARLFLGSGYNASRGGAPGLGHEIYRLSALDESGKPTADVINPAEGRMICVEQTKPKGSHYPSYSLRLGRQPAPIADLIAKMDAEEVSALTPLENVARELSEEEQWACLGKVIAPKNVALIRSSLARV
jgi:hypothetical protein